MGSSRQRLPNQVASYYTQSCGNDIDTCPHRSDFDASDDVAAFNMPQFRRHLCLIVFFVLCCLGIRCEFLVGVGKTDITGPVAETMAMGYAHAGQILNGLHTRLYSRAYLIGHPTDMNRRFVYVVIESCMASQLVTHHVIKTLKSAFGDLYTDANVAIAATHTHTAPGGYLQYFLYNMATIGFVRSVFEAHVEGIVKSIRIAHDNAQLGSIRYASGELPGANINRSPTAYGNNPPKERSPFERDVDILMHQCTFSTASNKELGILNWFPVHGTALNNTVKLISGDNKGVASQLMEKHMFKTGSPNMPFDVTSNTFVAAFAQSNSGDVSPNTAGSYCLGSGAACDADTSTCDKKYGPCHGRGPAWPDCFQSSAIIGEKQFHKAKELMGANTKDLDSTIDYRHIIVNMSAIVLDATGKTTCRPAVGYSFAAGTTDGPGVSQFKQGVTKPTFFGSMATMTIRYPSDRQTMCHLPKPILLDTGEMKSFGPWQPEILKLQILRMGSLVILCVPGEVTTMAGRRLRSAIENTVREDWGNVTVIISGLTNAYSSYITTREEYQVQRYEGASTLYGPGTLEAYTQEFVRLARDMVEGKERSSGLQSPNWLDRMISVAPPVILDSVPPWVHFGAVSRDRPKDCYHRGETVQVTFWSANPRSSQRIDGHSFLHVERYEPTNGIWETIARDGDLSTKFEWMPLARVGLIPFSHARLTWSIDDDTVDGTFRIRHAGHAKTSVMTSDVVPFDGWSSSFTVRNNCQSVT